MNLSTVANKSWIKIKTCCLKRFFSSVQVFNRDLHRTHKDNSALLLNSKEYEYLRNEIADRLVDRVEDIQREFPLVADIGCGSGYIYKQLQQNPGFGGIKELIQCDTSFNLLSRDQEYDSGDVKTFRVCSDEEYLPFPKHQFDLITSCMNMHWINDLPGFLSQVLDSLKPDGVFLGAMLGGETLKELRSSFILAEQERLGGVSSHISPFASVPDVGALMQNAGFNLPTVDTDYIQVEYENAFELMENLRGMGENHSPLNSSRFTSKETMMATAAAYAELYGNPDGSIPATFQVIYMIGWSPHKSQPLPKKRGSATRSFKELSKNMHEKE